MDFSIQNCALHTLGVPAIDYGDVQNILIFKQLKLMDHLLNNCQTVFRGGFLKKRKQFSGRESKNGCLLIIIVFDHDSIY